MPLEHVISAESASLKGRQLLEWDSVLGACSNALDTTTPFLPPKDQIFMPPRYWEAYSFAFIRTPSIRTSQFLCLQLLPNYNEDLPHTLTDD